MNAQLWAQLWLASVTSWVDRSRCLRAVDTAVELCGCHPDEDLRINALGHIAYWNLLFRSWDDADDRASAAALELARRQRDLAGLSVHANRRAFFLALSSRYREACLTAQEGVRVAVSMESMLDYSIGHFFEAWALLHAGEWGRLRTLVNSSIEMANRNGHLLWALLFGLLDAFLHVQALSFEHARRMCREYLLRARDLQHPLSVQMSLVLLGLSELGAGNAEAASESFSELRNWRKRERLLMDWIWNLPLLFGTTELCLVRGDLAGARMESEQFAAAASATAERTWQALAQYQLSRVASASGDTVAARREIGRALDIIKDHETPLATWRVYAQAGEQLGDHAFLDRSHSIVLKLASSLGTEDDLRRTFIASAHVAHHHGKTQRSSAC